MAALQEVQALRAEVEDIRRRVALIQEAHSLRSEVTAIQREIQVLLQKQKEEEQNHLEKEKRAREEVEKREREEKEKQIRLEKERAEKEAAERRQQEEVKAREAKEREERERRAKEEREKQAAATATKAATRPTPTSSTSSTPSGVPLASKASSSGSSSTNFGSRTTSTAPSSSTTSNTNAPVNRASAQVRVPTNVAKVDNQPDKYMEQRLEQERSEADALYNARNKQPEKPEFLAYGLDADLAKKAKEKYDPKLEEEVREWIEAVTGEKLQGNFAQALRSGVILCNLANKIKPGSVAKINKMSMAFMQMENINNFLNAAKALGVPNPDLFMTVDLYEEKNLNQVIQCLHSLGRCVRKVPGYNGPAIGPKLSDRHEVTFTEEQLRRGQNELNFSQSVQKETQKTVSEYLRPGLDSVVKSHETGSTTATLSPLDQPKLDAQKDANEARRARHNIIK